MGSVVSSPSSVSSSSPDISPSLRFFFSESNPPLDPPSSGPYTIQEIFEGRVPFHLGSHWKDSVANLIAGLIESPATDHFHVEALHIYKESASSPFHEMLLFEVVSDTLQKIFIRIDRFIRTGDSRTLGMFVPATSSNFGSELKCSATDEAHIALSDSFVEKTFHKAMTAYFHPNNDSFRRLLDLLGIITNDYGDYNLLNRSCYWFTAVVYKTFCMEFEPYEQKEGKAQKSLGKFSNDGQGTEWLSVVPDEQGKIYWSWRSNRFKLTPICKFLRKEAGTASLVFDQGRRAFLARPPTGKDILVLKGEGVLSDDRPEHIASGDQVADLSGCVVQIVNPDSLLLDLRFETLEQAQVYFSHLRDVLRGREFATLPASVMVQVDRRHTTVLFAQRPTGPFQFDCLGAPPPATPRLEHFSPVDFGLQRVFGGVKPVVESYGPLAIVLRDSNQAINWKQEFVIQSGRAPSVDAWTAYWQKYFEA